MKRLEIYRQYYTLGQEQRALKGLATLIDCYERVHLEINFHERNDTERLAECTEILDCIALSVNAIADNIGTTKERLKEQAERVNNAIDQKQDEVK